MSWSGFGPTLVAGPSSVGGPPMPYSQTTEVAIIQASYCFSRRERAAGKCIILFSRRERCGGTGDQQYNNRGAGQKCKARVDPVLHAGLMGLVKGHQGHPTRELGARRGPLSPPSRSWSLHQSPRMQRQTSLSLSLFSHEGYRSLSCSLGPSSVGAGRGILPSCTCLPSDTTSAAACVAQPVVLAG